MRKTLLAVTVLGLCVGTVVSPAMTRTAHAQQDRIPITLDLRDAPIRDALDQLFKTAKVDYVLDNNIQGYVTLKITDQPFSNALRLIMRAATPPLTYVNENNVYIIKVRSTTDTGPNTAPPPPDPTLDRPASRNNRPEQIPLIYADPADIAAVIPMTFIQIGVRQGQSGGQGGGQGGGGFGGGLGGGGGGGISGGGGLGGGGFGGGGFGGGRAF